MALFLAVSVGAQQKLQSGAAAPEFSGASINGQWYDLNQLQGKVVVITFWSTRCGICHSEIPKLNRLAERYKGQDVVFLALTMENESKVESYIRSTPFNFNILPNSFAVVLQYADRDRLGNIDMGFPAHFLVDQNGSIEFRSSGFDKTGDLDSRISRLLTSNSNSAASASTQK